MRERQTRGRAAWVPIFTATGVISGVMAISAPRRQGRQACFECTHAERIGVLEIEAQTYISPLRTPATMRMASVEPTSARLRRVAGRPAGRYPPLHRAKPTAAEDGDDQTADRPPGRPTPVAAFAECQHDRHQDHRDQDRAVHVDRTWRSGSRDSSTVIMVIGMHTSGDRGVDPEQPLPAGESDQYPADQRAECSAGGRSRAPQCDRLHLRGTRRGDREQAHAAREDRRAGGALDHPADDHPGTLLGERDEHA